MILTIVLILLLVACGKVASTNNSIFTPLTISETSSQVMENFATSTFTPRPSVTPFPSHTPDITQTTLSQYLISTYSAEQTLVPQYPHVCKDNYMEQEFSPEESWLVEECYSEDVQSPILTISNKATKVLWKLTLRDYIHAPTQDYLQNIALRIVDWSSDQSYVYFGLIPTVDGGECFVTRNSEYISHGLFRINLETGDVKTVLPLQDDLRSYDLSFSPTGRRLIYSSGPSDLKILDIKSGVLIQIKPTNKNQFGGGYLWSTDGLKFIYSTVSYGDNGPIDYSLRLVDSQSGIEHILLESPKDCFVVSEWIDNRITVECYDEQYNQTLIDFDLNSNQIISEATATPHP